MKQIWSKVVSGAAALVCAGAANASVIDFESLDTTNAPFAPLLADGDSVAQGGYLIRAVDANNAGASNGSLVGQLMNGSDASSCLDGACSAGDSTNYLAAVNNGLLAVSGQGTLTLGSFAAAFLPAASVALPATTVAYLAVEANRSDGSYAVGIFNLLGPNASGVTSFASFDAASASIIDGTGTLTSGNVESLVFYAYYCGSSTSCSAFNSDRGQFAIDDIGVNVAAVPEPAEWALMAAGLGFVGLKGLRRRRAA